MAGLAARDGGPRITGVNDPETNPIQLPTHPQSLHFDFIDAA
jgi:hypothetical protein